MTDIYELRKAKGDMAVAIQRIIREFEKNTGSIVEYVNIAHVMSKGDLEPGSLLALVDVKVTI